MPAPPVGSVAENAITIGGRAGSDIRGGEGPARYWHAARRSAKMGRPIVT